jgi:hypothetical protein
MHSKPLQSIIILEELYILIHYLWPRTQNKLHIPIMLEKSLIYNSQVRNIRCYSTGASSSDEEVVIKDGDLDVSIGPSKSIQ